MGMGGGTVMDTMKKLTVVALLLTYGVVSYWCGYGQAKLDCGRQHTSAEARFPNRGSSEAR
jgi:hypothetical protein